MQALPYMTDSRRARCAELQARWDAACLLATIPVGQVRVSFDHHDHITGVTYCAQGHELRGHAYLTIERLYKVACKMRQWGQAFHIVGHSDSGEHICKRTTTLLSGQEWLFAMYNSRIGYHTVELRRGTTSMMKLSRGIVPSPYSDDPPGTMAWSREQLTLEPEHVDEPA